MGITYQSLSFFFFYYYFFLFFPYRKYQLHFLFGDKMFYFQNYFSKYLFQVDWIRNPTFITSSINAFRIQLKLESFTVYIYIYRLLSPLHLQKSL